ncbi:microtubule-associated protein 1B-like [Ambystoma mexicanum]|uniref:microtubule-associated protein 1B-like n=1 Tax=Ambystoma mexicanum TaxID=8296 RepID=UPI0037E7D327
MLTRALMVGLTLTLGVTLLGLDAKPLSKKSAQREWESVLDAIELAFGSIVNSTMPEAAEICESILRDPHYGKVRKYVVKQASDVTHFFDKLDQELSDALKKEMCKDKKSKKRKDEAHEPEEKIGNYIHEIFEAIVSFTEGYNNTIYDEMKEEICKELKSKKKKSEGQKHKEAQKEKEDLTLLLKYLHKQYEALEKTIKAQLKKDICKEKQPEQNEEKSSEKGILRKMIDVLDYFVYTSESMIYVQLKKELCVEEEPTQQTQVAYGQQQEKKEYWSDMLLAITEFLEDFDKTVEAELKAEICKEKKPEEQKPQAHELQKKHTKTYLRIMMDGVDQIFDGIDKKVYADMKKEYCNEKKPGEKPGEKPEEKPGFHGEKPGFYAEPQEQH